MSRDTGSSSIDGGEYAQARAVRAQPQWGLLGFEHERLAAVVPVRDGPVRVGRDADCDLRFQDGSVSRLHCTLSLIGDAVQVRDAGSLNGIFRAGVRLDAALLGEGDELSLGNAFVKLVDLRRPAWTIHERLHDELYRDAATGLSNRRSFQRKSEAAVASLRPDQPLGAVHIEAAGDRAAREEHIAVLGGILRKLQRTGLFAAHFGEGRFGCLLSGASPDALRRFADAVLNEVDAARGACGRFEITIGGVSEIAPLSASTLLYAAEDACLIARAEQRKFFLLARPDAGGSPRPSLLDGPRGRFALQQ